MDLKNRKNEKMAKNSQFWACFGVFEWLNLFRLNFALAEKLYFLPFLEIMMVGKLKSPAIVRNKTFCVKNVDLSPNHQVFLVKMYLKSNIRHNRLKLLWNIKFTLMFHYMNEKEVTFNVKLSSIPLFSMHGIPPSWYTSLESKTLLTHHPPHHALKTGV